MNRVKSIWRTAVCIALSLLLLACGKESHQKEKTVTALPVGKKALNVGLNAGVPTLDPVFSSGTFSERVLSDLFEGLVSLDQNNVPVPGVAKSWDISNNHLVYTFYLRNNARWSNGEPVTAQDFVFSLRRAVTPRSTAVLGALLAGIKNASGILAGKKAADSLGVKAINDRTLRIVLAHPQPYFLFILANTIAFPVYPPLVKKYGKSWANPNHIVSNGAYKLKSWVINGNLSLVRNPDYWDAKHVNIDTVNFYPIVSPSDAYNQYLSGRLDMTFSLPQNTTIAYYKKHYGKQFVHVTQLANYFYWMNVKKPGLNKLGVRKALTMAVDRKAITSHVVKMGQTPLYSIVPSGMQHGIYADLYKKIPDYNWVAWPMEKRDAEARKLLAKAGYSRAHPLTVTIVYNTNPTHLRVVQAIAQMWDRAFHGAVKVELRNEEWKVYLQTLNKGTFDLARESWTGNYDMASDFVSLTVCDSANNHGQFCDKTLDHYYYAGISSKSIKGYNKNMKKAIEVSMKNYYVIPVFNRVYFRLVKSYIGGYHYSGNHLDQVYSRWFYFKK